jgi:hypothetical protein
MALCANGSHSPTVWRMGQFAQCSRSRRRNCPSVVKVFVSRDHEGLPKFVLVGRGRVATTSPRQDLSAGRHARGVSQRRICSATEKRIGLPLGLVPVLVKQCPLDSVAPKPEVVVANVAFRDKRLSGGQRSLSFFPNIRRQGDETMDERTPEAGPGLVGDLAAPASQRQGLAPATAGQCNFRALGEDKGFVPSRLQCAPVPAPRPGTRRLRRSDPPSGRNRATEWRTFVRGGCRSCLQFRALCAYG